MRLLTTLLALAAIQIGYGCASAPPPPPPPSSSHPAHLTPAVARGRAPELATGNYRAYWIWLDDDGVWHLRTTARRTGHHYQGVIRPLEGAEITDLTLVGIDPKDRVGLVGRDLSFDWRTRRMIDGFDFRVSGTGGLEFDLRLDDDGTSRYIYLGKNKVRPDRAHFVIGP